MIKKIIKKINCPECGKINKVMLWDKINVQLNPEIKKKLLNGNLNKLKCSKCSHIFRVEIPLAYQNMEKKFLIYFDPNCFLGEEKKTIDELNGKILYITKDKEYKNKIRLVFDYETFLEKIKIFEDKLDDRGIELVKLLARTQLKLIKGNSFYLKKKEEKLEFIFFEKEKQKNNNYNFDLPKKMYKETMEIIKKKDKESKILGFRIIDISFAVKISCSA